MAKVLVYQMYPLAWPNLSSMTKHLHRIAKLGVDYVWLNPIYPSPRFDHGYDISDHMAVDPRIGSAWNLDYFVDTAHNLGIKVIVDLVLNHTSTQHPWFRTHPEFYCWSSWSQGGWTNLFNHGSAWRYRSANGRYYLHLFHPEEADLNWFPDGQLSKPLLKRFRKIINYWLSEHDIDGFRLDFPQALNKNLDLERCDLDSLLYGDRAVEVIQALFPKDTKKPFLMMECFDPSFGDIVRQYIKSTPVDYVVNTAIKTSVDFGLDVFLGNAAKSELQHGLMLETESHDSPRFPSVSGLPPETALWCLFNSRAQAIRLYQGQEMGLKNPSHKELSDNQLLELDAITKMRFDVGEDLSLLRLRSRANARVPLNLSVYDRQMNSPSSYFNYTRELIARWRAIRV